MWGSQDSHNHKAQRKKLKTFDSSSGNPCGHLRENQCCLTSWSPVCIVAQVSAGERHTGLELSFRCSRPRVFSSNLELERSVVKK